LPLYLTSQFIQLLLSLVDLLPFIFKLSFLAFDLILKSFRLSLGRLYGSFIVLEFGYPKRRDTIDSAITTTHQIRPRVYR